jgi:long-chain acyl-CoA synthetase
VVFVSLLDAVASADPASVAVIEGDRRLTYGALVDLVGRTAAGLRRRGVVPGGRVAVAAPAGLDGVVAYLGIQAAGCAAAMLNPRSPRPELEAQLDQLDVALVVLGADRVDLPANIPAARPAGSVSNLDLPVLDEPAVGDVTISEGSPAAILFTSGVAGAPRPAILSHANLAAVQQGVIDQPGSGIAPSTIALGVLPLAHVFGLNSVLGTMLRAGGSVVLADRFDAAETLELVVRHGVTAIPAVPQMWAAWADVPDPPPHAMATVTRAMSSAEHLPSATAGVVLERFGVRIGGGYGLTETAGTIVLDDLSSPSLAAVGRPLGAIQLRLVDLEGVDVELGDRGEIWVRGPSVFLGYAGRELSLPSLFHPGGWYRTGDVGILDDQGRLTIVARIKDVVIVGGFNVSPTEVEDVLTSHPAVSAALVVGEPDGRGGERVAAFVIPSAGLAMPEPAALQEFCRRRLARYKVPARIEVRAKLPATDTGKPIRRLLRDPGDERQWDGPSAKDSTADSDRSA